MEKFIKEHNLPYKKVASNVRYAEMKFDWDDETSKKWYKTHGDKMMSEIPCKPNAVETINKLHDMGHKIVISTARNSIWHEDPFSVTLKWLDDWKIKYDRIYIGRSDKEEVCKEVNANFFMDDDILITGNVAKAMSRKNNFHTFIAETAYNKDLEKVEGVEVIKDWIDFDQKIMEILKKIK